MAGIRNLIVRASVASVALALALAGVTAVVLPSSAAAGGGSISGTVRAAGVGLPNPYVYLYQQDGPSWRAVRIGGHVPFGTADYVFDDLGPGTYRVMVSNPGEPWVETFHPSADLLENAADIVLAEGQDVTGKDVDLLREGRVRGTVSDADGRPLAGVEVTVTDTDQATRYVETETDAEGRYEVGRLTTDDYVVLFDGHQVGMGAEYWPDAPTRTLARPVAVVSGEDDAGIDSVLEQPGILRGTVTDALTGDPVAYAAITLYELRDGDWQGTRSTTGTDARGRYELKGVWGTYRVLAVGPGYDTHGYAFHPDVPDVDAAASVTVPEGGSAGGVDIALARQPGTSTISGRVVASGTAAAGMVVTAELRVGDDGWWRAASVTTAADGSYRAYVGYPGTYRISFTDPSGDLDDRWWRDRVSAATATPLEIPRGGSTVTGIDAEMAPVPGGALGGAVTGWADEPLADVDVTLFERSTITSAWTEVVTVGTDASGRWGVPDLPAGTYRVGYVDDSDRHVPEFHLDSPDVASAEDVEVRAGGTTTLSATLAPADGSIAGRVTGEDDLVPIDGIRVTVYGPADGGWTALDETGVDEDGDYVLDGLAPGDYRVGFEDEAGLLVGEFWYDAPALTAAWDVEVLPGGETGLYWADLASKDVTPTPEPTPSPSPSPSTSPSPTTGPVASPSTPTPTTTSTVAPAQPAPAISNTARPRIAGTPVVGRVLRARPGGWSPSAVVLTYEWRADGRRIRRADGPRLFVTRTLLGARVSVRVRATLDGAADVVARSRPAAKVTPRARM
ncbi:5-hydroxyisourate hydrolase-like protein (transthyretin family) [Nocardioides cavernae]|uniref:alpha-amylase n=1 Tax=Nocardioides cavernae TaxID=1921566 RepID=A0A7Y9H261_9ACTN|nr:carboxypeptidase regulatory-like domain-containing protein [Nocardioides cavernae]NYE36557.1 5-hydroxyisourate hydrolase-like protein (transthyretin family) [Nocardioides cavernae]